MTNEKKKEEDKKKKRMIGVEMSIENGKQEKELGQIFVVVREGQFELEDEKKEHFLECKMVEWWWWEL